MYREFCITTERVLPFVFLFPSEVILIQWNMDQKPFIHYTGMVVAKLSTGLLGKSTKKINLFQREAGL
jgi:hypothetical protein